MSLVCCKLQPRRKANNQNASTSAIIRATIGEPISCSVPSRGCEGGISVAETVPAMRIAIGRTLSAVTSATGSFYAEHNGQTQTAAPPTVVYQTVNYNQPAETPSQTARRLAEAQFTPALATFTASGMDTDTAMERASDMVRHRALRAQLESCRRQMLEGRSLAQAVYDNRVFEPLYARMLMSGARSGNLDQVLARLAQVFSEDANMRMGRIIDSVEPVLAGFLTVSVGITLLAVMLPLIGILTSIG